MRFWVFCIILCLLFSNNLFAFQNIGDQSQKMPFVQEVENIWPKVIDHYKSGRYGLVEETLKGLLNIYPLNHRITGILYLLSRSQFEQRKYKEAYENLQSLLNFQTSDYFDDAHYLQSLISFKQEKYLDAAGSLFAVLEVSTDKNLKDQSQKNLTALFTDYVDYDDIRILKNSYNSSLSQSIFEFAEAIQSYRIGDNQNAIAVLKDIVSKTPVGILKTEFENYLDLIENAPIANLKIGVILPLTGFFSEEAKELLRGIQYALNENPIAQKMEIELAVRDSQGEMLSTINMVEDLIKNENVIGIIGEIESDKSAVIGKLTESSGIPVISPTAIETGLNEISSNLFQMKPNISVIGERIADYAFNELNLQSYAILAPADKYGKNIADSFAQKVDQAGGIIVAETFFYEGATDLRDQFSRFRKVGLQKMERDSILFENPFYNRVQIDSVITAMRQLELEEEEEEEEEEPTRAIKPADSTATPVTSIDAIFLPIYTEQIAYVAPQLALYNIQTQLIGGNYWNDYDELVKNEKYVEGAIFSTDFMIDEGDFDFIKFRNNYRIAMHETPGKMDVSGFDSMNFLLEGLSYSKSRKELLDNLMKINYFKGLVSEYQFMDNQRLNTKLTFLRYQNNLIRKIE